MIRNFFFCGQSIWKGMVKQMPGDWDSPGPYLLGLGLVGLSVEVGRWCWGGGRISKRDDKVLFWVFLLCWTMQTGYRMESTVWDMC